MVVWHRIFLTCFYLTISTVLWFSSPVLAASYKDAKDIFNSGLDHVRQQNYQQALLDFTEVINLRDNLVGAAYSNRCLVNIHLQKYSAAKSDCTRAIDYAPNNLEAYLDLGLVYYRREEYDRAIAKYQYVIQRDRDNYRAYYNLGLVYFALEDYQQAIKDYSLALSSPRSMSSRQKALIYSDRGVSHLMLANYDRGISDLNQAINLDSNNYSAYYNRGCIYHHQKNYAAALDDFTQVLQLDQDFTQAYVNRAVLYYQLGKYNFAFRDINIALKQYEQQGNSLSYQKVLALKKQFRQVIVDSQPNQFAQTIPIFMNG